MIGHGFEQGLADLHGLLVRGFLHAKGARVATATFVRVNAGARHHLQHFFSFFADVLHAAMAGNLVADLAQSHREINLQQSIALSLHQVLKRIPHRVFHELHIRILRVHQRDFLLEHQRTAGHRGQNGVALFGVPGQHRDVGLFAGVDRIQVTQLQLGHAATFFFFNDDVRHVVVVKNFEQIVPNAGLVVVDIAGGVNGNLARRFCASVRHRSFSLGRARAKLLRCQCRQPGVLVHAKR